MSVAINADDTESLRAEIETEYRQDDPEVPDETEAANETGSAYYCCG